MILLVTCRSSAPRRGAAKEERGSMATRCNHSKHMLLIQFISQPLRCTKSLDNLSALSAQGFEKPLGSSKLPSMHESQIVSKDFAYVLSMEYDNDCFCLVTCILVASRCCLFHCSFGSQLGWVRPIECFIVVSQLKEIKISADSTIT